MRPNKPRIELIALDTAETSFEKLRYRATMEYDTSKAEIFFDIPGKSLTIDRDRNDATAWYRKELLAIADALKEAAAKL